MSHPRPPRNSPPRPPREGAPSQPPPAFSAAPSSSYPYLNQGRHPSEYDPPSRPPFPSASSSSTSYAGGQPPKVQFTKASYYSQNGDSSSQADVPLVGYSSALGGGGGPNGGVGGGLGAAMGGGGGSGADFKRKRSLVRPDRERVDENHRLYNYRQHAAAMEAEGRGTAAVSRTGHYAAAGLPIPVTPAELSGATTAQGQAAQNGSTTLRRGKSILAREEGMANETGLNIFKRGGTLRRPKSAAGGQQAMPGGAYEKRKKAKAAKQPLGAWMIYCMVVTACFPPALLKCFGASSSSSSLLFFGNPATGY